MQNYLFSSVLKFYNVRNYIFFKLMESSSYPKKMILAAKKLRNVKRMKFRFSNIRVLFIAW